MRFSRWLGITAQDLFTGGHRESVPRMQLRVKVPRGFQLDTSRLAARLLGIRRGRGRGSERPDLVLTVVRFAKPLNTVSAILAGDARQFGRPEGRITVRRAIHQGNVELGHIEVTRQAEDIVDVSNVRPVDGNVWICGYRTPKRASRVKLEQVSRSVLASLEVEFPREVESSDGRIEVRSSGFSVVPPRAWEQQELMGEILFYAPGKGFRPRFSFSAHDDEEKDWNPLRVQARLAVEGLAYALERVAADPPRPLNLAGRKGLRIDARGCLARKEAWVRVAILLLPNRRRGAHLTFMCLEGSFDRFLPEVLASAKSIRWLSKER